jgi:hypothetical protein
MTSLRRCLHREPPRRRGARHVHVLVTDGVFSAGDDGEAIFHPALDLEREDFAAVQAKMRHRGLRWLHRHGHIDDDALHVLDSSEHAGGWSVDASVTIPGWDRHGPSSAWRAAADDVPTSA